MSLSLPIPRMPAIPAMPDPDALDALLPGAGDPVRAALGAIAETVEAIDALESGRPAGLDWISAREADRRAVTAGKPATRLAAVIAGDGKRYSAALALAATLSDRGRPVPVEGLAEAAARDAGSLLAPLRTVILSMSRALEDGRRSAAHKAHEQGATVLAALADLQAIHRWATGGEYAVTPPTLDRALYETWMDSTEILDGVDPADSWRVGEAREAQRAAFEANLVDRMRRGIE